MVSVEIRNLIISLKKREESGGDQSDRQEFMFIEDGGKSTAKNGKNAREEEANGPERNYSRRNAKKDHSSIDNWTAPNVHSRSFQEGESEPNYCRKIVEKGEHQSV